MARIFLCHASEDKPQVEEVYHRLEQEEGLEPWMDQMDLLPGQNWREEIPRALRASEFIVIFCLRTRRGKEAMYNGSLSWLWTF